MRQVGLVGMAIWAIVMVCVGGLLSLSQWAVVDGDLADYGLVFLGYVAMTSVIARRCMDISMVVVAVWGAAVGLWGPGWMRLCDLAISRWAAQIGMGELLAGDEIRGAIAAAAAGILTSALLYIATKSSKVVMLTVTASLAAAGLMAFAAKYDWAEAAAIMAWNALVAGGMCSWMVQGVHRRTRGCCPRCGQNVQGLSSPVCPACSAVLRTSADGAVGLMPLANRRPV